MNASPAPFRWLALAATVAVFASVLVFLSRVGRNADSGPMSAGPVRAETASDQRNWPLFGGTPSRNLVNLVETGMPLTWSVQKGAEKNVKWVAELGSKAYGGPVVYRGKIFVGTNNNNPRN